MSSPSFERYQQEASFTQVCGHQIAYWQSYELAGTDKQQTILFIHGFPSASWDWHYQWKYLARDYPLLCADLLGFGLSAKPRKHRYSLLEQADIIEALLAERGVADYHVMAHDYGDSVAQELLYRQTQRLHDKCSLPQARLKSICFLNGGLFPACHRPLFTQRLLSSRLGFLLVKYLKKRSLEKSFYKIFGNNTPPMQPEIDMTWQLLQHNNGHLVIPDILRYIDERKAWSERWVSAMINAAIPLYFINGVQDPISGRHMLDHYIKVIPDAQTAVLDVGHYPQLEAPDEVLRIYRAFLSRIQAE